VIDTPDLGTAGLVVVSGEHMVADWWIERIVITDKRVDDVHRQHTHRCD